jgi:hypothetical protein
VGMTYRMGNAPSGDLIDSKCHKTAVQESFVR